MSRTAVRLTLDNLEGLPQACRSCLFWECDAVRRARLDDPAAEKAAWVSEVLREWGSCGRVALIDGDPVGHVLYAPARFVPGAAGFATSPVSPDAVLLTTAWVDPRWRAGGVGRLLVRAMARDLVDREVRAVEAFGHRARSRSGDQMSGDPSGRAQGCTVPADFLTGVGFRTQRDHPVTPRMRMDLRSALSLKGEVEAALERLVGAVRPRSEPRRAPGSVGAGRSSRVR